MLLNGRSQAFLRRSSQPTRPRASSTTRTFRVLCMTRKAASSTASTVQPAVTLPRMLLPVVPQPQGRLRSLMSVGQRLRNRAGRESHSGHAVDDQLHEYSGRLLRDGAQHREPHQRHRRRYNRCRGADQRHQRQRLRRNTLWPAGSTTVAGGLSFQPRRLRSVLLEPQCTGTTCRSADSVATGPIPICRPICRNRTWSRRSRATSLRSTIAATTFAPRLRPPARKIPSSLRLPWRFRASSA